MNHLHFMGIGGVSMQGLARWWHADGKTVSGCDLHDGPALRSLRAAGIHVAIGHDPDHLEGVDTLVTSMAVPAAHPEIVRARQLGIRVMPRIELLAELFTRRSALAVTGSHGKSTTTGMAATLFMAAAVDPSVLLGASLPSLEHNMRYGAGRHVVAEVDESDPGFAMLRAEVAVVTNLSDDHVAGDHSERRNYHATLDDLHAATAHFASRAEHVVYNGDWPGLRALLGAHPAGASFGHGEGVDYRISAVLRAERETRFELRLPSGRNVPVRLVVPLRHNVLNAAAALAAADVAGLDLVALAPALAAFDGVGRRWQSWGSLDGAEIVDDYAVHPTEVHAILSAAKETGRRVRAVLQPHRWVRTAQHWPGLVDATALADEVLVLDVYAAGEAAIPGISPDLIVTRLRERGRDASRHTLASAITYLRGSVRDGDLVMTLGAGDVWRVAEALMNGTTPAVERAPARVRLGDHTTLKVGGPAELWTAESDADLRAATAEPYRILGAGSNLLVADAGVAERVVRLGRAFATLDAMAGGVDLWLGAATPLPGLVRRAQRLGLSGLEGLLGVPAVLGGAVAMNAGTRFGQLSDTLREVEVFLGGARDILGADEIGLGYRRSALPHGAIVTRVRLALVASTPEHVQRAMDAVDAARKGQPKVKSAGCAFKNPPGASAGRLIDAAGLKGLRVGDAMISHEHANFVVNLGSATAEDVVQLLEAVRASVATPLELEWRRWGFVDGDPAFPGAPSADASSADASSGADAPLAR